MRALKSLAAVAIAVAGLIVPATASQAVAVISTTPATGTNTSALTLGATAACTNEDADTKLQVFLTGPGFPAGGYSIFNKSAASNVKSGAGYSIPLLKTMQAAANAQNPAATLGGRYTFTVNCYQGLSDTATALGSTDIWFTSTTAYVSSDPAVSVELALQASTTDTTSSTEVTFTATTTPGNAVGSVEFFDGQTSLGTVSVSGGSAAKSVTFSSDGAGRIKSHSVHAVFTPTDSLAFASATSTDVSVKVTTPPSAGTVSVSPADGTSSTAIEIFTTQTCVEPTVSTKLQITMTGDGFPEGGINVTPRAAESSVARSGSGYHTYLSLSMATFAAQQNPPATLDGRYDFTVKCFEGISNNPTAIIGTTTVWFTSPTVYQSTEPSRGTATSLVTTISPVGSVVSGQSVQFSAAVTPAEATGAVAFTATPVSGGGSPIDLGSGTVSAGVATITYSQLAGGASSGLPKSYRIDAHFTSSSELYFDSDAEQKTLVVLAKLVPANTVTPSMTAAKVGTALTCSVGTWNDASTYTITIKVAGVTVKTGAGSSTAYTPVAANLGKQITCAVTAKSADNVSVTANAAAKTVAEGAPLKVVSGKGPKVSGTVKVGQRLTATSGMWSPAAKTYSYQWVTIVGSKATPIAKATAATFTIPSSLKGKTLGVIVTAGLPGYADGAVTLTAGKVA